MKVIEVNVKSDYEGYKKVFCFINVCILQLILLNECEGIYVVFFLKN